MDINTIFKLKSNIIKMILSILGILLISLSIFLFNCTINKPLSDVDNLFKILISPVLGGVGMRLIFINFNSKKVRLGIIGAIIVGAFIFSSSFRIATLGIIIISILITFLVKFFVTVITLSLDLLIWLIIARIGLSILPSHYYVIIYSCITFGLIIYLSLGTMVNKLIIENTCRGKNLEPYNYEDLKQNLNVIYIIIFFLLNVSTALYNDKLDFYNLINNSFITVITITQVNWPKIFNLEKIKMVIKHKLIKYLN